MKKPLLISATAAIAVGGGVGIATADKRGPETIPLPTGFQPEGIAAANGQRVVVGSIPTGALWIGDVKKGSGRILEPGAEGRAAIGVEVRGKRIYVAGGPTGKVRVHDLKTGDVVREEQAGPAGGTFVNDVVVTDDAAWFTDSRRDVLYKWSRKGGPVTELKLTGAFQLVEGFNLNGIEAFRDGKVLVAVQSATGKLFRIDAATGATEEIDTGGVTLTNGDGLLRKGSRLHVVQNRLNRIAVLKISDDVRRARVEKTLTDPDFDVPTTVARVGNVLYAVNARFGTPDAPNASYAVVRVNGTSAASVKAKGKDKDKRDRSERDRDDR